MPQPSVAELELLRTQPHRTRFYLSIYKPSTILACRVNEAGIVKGERIITYDGVTEGSHTNVERGMTMRVGSTAGDDDKGTIYVKEADASEITVGENSHIDWADDLYLTVIDFFQIWPLYPRYQEILGNVIIYKDYDVAYNNQNVDLGSLICMGPHHAGFLCSGTHQVYYTASGTTNVAGNAMTYAWEFDGGTPTGSSSITPGWVTYDTAGHYSTRLTVTATGAEEKSHRHISIYDRPGEGDDVPILSWGFNGTLNGDRDAGGYSVELWVRENIGDIEDGALAIIFADDWYGTTQQSIGGNAPNRSSIVFIGYVIGETIEYDYQSSKVEFTISSPTELMKNVESFSVSVQDSLFPKIDALFNGGSVWFYLKGLTMESAIYHYTRWHTTVNLCCDIEYNATDFNLQFFDADRESLFSALRTIMETAVFGRVVCDRQGKIWCEIEYEAVDNASTVLPLNMFLDKHDWMGRLDIKEQVVPKVSWLETGGVWWKGKLLNSFEPLLSAAPGEVPAYRGAQQRLQGLALSGQGQLNTLTGNVFANRNARFPDVGMRIAGNYRNFDIAPQERVSITMDNETFRQLNWTNKDFAIKRVSFRLDTERQMVLPTLRVSEIVQGFAADTVEIPIEPPWIGDGFGSPNNIYGDTGFDIPEIEIPPIPALPTIDFPSGYFWGASGTYAFGQAKQIISSSLPSPPPHDMVFSGSDYKMMVGVSEYGGGIQILYTGYYHVIGTFGVIDGNNTLSLSAGVIQTRAAVEIDAHDLQLQHSATLGADQDREIEAGWYYYCLPGDYFILRLTYWASDASGLIGSLRLHKIA